MLSHFSAAWLWGLVSGCGTLIDVTAVVPRHLQAGIRVHSAKTVAPEDTTTTEGIAVTAIPRTLLDLAGASSHVLNRALSNCTRLGQLDIASIDALVARSSGLRGVARLRLALDDFREPAFTRSGVERRFLRLVREAGLPRPSTNLFVEGYELDAYWPVARFAVELDTYEYHGDRRAFESDRIRQENLKLKGIEMVRFTGSRLDREPGAVMRRLKQLLEQRR